MSKVLVIGGGAAGCMAAYSAALCGHEVTLLEKNEKIGKKIYITGKGRCNVTNASDIETILANINSNPKFLYSPIYTFSNESVMDFFTERNIPLKIERGNRVFPVSDHSSDIIKGLENALKSENVSIKLFSEVSELLLSDDVCIGVKLSNGREIRADHVIVATGGISYSSTGSTGDGIRWAENSGHRITPLSPALVPLNVSEEWVKELTGLSLKNVTFRLIDNGKTIYEEFGELLFTHFGISGPLVLTATAKLKDTYFRKNLVGEIDLKPALTHEEMDNRLLKDFGENLNKNLRNGINHLFPARLSDAMVALSGISVEKKCNEITKEERIRFAELIKGLDFTVTGKRGFNEAIITKGGISVKDIDPATMKSKKINNLSFCGEVLDLDANTGGYNLQIAWSTGYLAGISVS